MYIYGPEGWALVGPLGPDGPGPDGPPGATLLEKAGQLPLTYFLSITAMGKCHIYIYISYVNIYMYV